MEFTFAKQFVMPFGKYKGDTLFGIGSGDEGLRYLDWLIGQDWVNGRTRDAIESFLRHPSFARRLDEILEDS